VAGDYHPGQMMSLPYPSLGTNLYYYGIDNNSVIPAAQPAQA
jgi:hypothetical protein